MPQMISKTQKETIGQMLLETGKWYLRGIPVMFGLKDRESVYRRLLGEPKIVFNSVLIELDVEEFAKKESFNFLHLIPHIDEKTTEYLLDFIYGRGVSFPYYSTVQEHCQQVAFYYTRYLEGFLVDRVACQVGKHVTLTLGDYATIAGLEPARHLMNEALSTRKIGEPEGETLVEKGDNCGILFYPELDLEHFKTLFALQPSLYVVPLPKYLPLKVQPTYSCLVVVKNALEVLGSSLLPFIPSEVVADVELLKT